MQIVGCPHLLKDRRSSMGDRRLRASPAVLSTTAVAEQRLRRGRKGRKTEKEKRKEKGERRRKNLIFESGDRDARVSPKQSWADEIQMVMSGGEQRDLMVDRLEVLLEWNHNRNAQKGLQLSYVCRRDEEVEISIDEAKRESDYSRFALIGYVAAQKQVWHMKKAPINEEKPEEVCTPPNEGDFAKFSAKKSPPRRILANVHVFVVHLVLRVLD
ncbi:hypothetical protein Drorol1_Dr00020783 [Drosera rotundifolia]